MARHPQPDRIKQILYLVWGFPPPGVPGTEQSLAAVNAFARRGHGVTVLCADLEASEAVLGAGRDSAPRVDPAVRVVRVRQPPGILDPLINRWPATRTARPSRWTRTVGQMVAAIQPEPKLAGWYPAWRHPAFAAARTLHSHLVFDLVVADVPPAVAAGVGLDLNVTAEVPLLLVERDSWLSDPAAAQPPASAEAARGMLEEILRRCVRAWCSLPQEVECRRRDFPQWAAKLRQVGDERGARPGQGLATAVGDLEEALGW